MPETLEDDEFPHLSSDQTFSLGVGFSLEEFVAGRFGGESEGGKSVHDKVDPQHLNGVERRFSQDGTTNKGHNKSHEVDGQLELQEFSDRVENISSPLHGSHNGAEVVVEKDDA